MSELLDLHADQELDLDWAEKLVDRADPAQYGSHAVGGSVEFGTGFEDNRQIRVTDLTPNAQKLDINVRHET